MPTVSIDAFSDSVQAKLIEQDLRVRPWPSAQQMWERSFLESDRTRLVLGQSEKLGLRRGGDFGITSGNLTRTKEGSQWRRSISFG